MAGPARRIHVDPRTPQQLRAVLNELQRGVEILVTNLGDLEDVFVIGTSEAAESVSAGDAIYPTGNDTVGKALATTAARSRVIGFALNGTSIGETVIYQNAGSVTLSGLTVGRYWLSAVTPGAIVSTPDASPGDRIVPVGVATSTTKLLFLPSSTILL